MSLLRRTSRFLKSRCGKILFRLVLPLYVIQCVLLFTGDVLQGHPTQDDNTLELQFLAFRPDINLLFFPEDEDVVTQRISPVVPPTATASSAIKVAIGLAITSKSLKDISAENITQQYVFFRDFLPSFCATRSVDKNYEYSVYVGYDSVDWYLKDNDNRRTFEDAFEQVIHKHCDAPVYLRMVSCPYTARPAWSQNDAMMEAYIDENDYFYRINDDIVLTSINWTSIFIDRLSNYVPKNVGVVAPLHSGGNQRHMEFDFVHRTHVDIFGWYYPRVFLDLYGDIWMGWVYAPGRAEKLATVTLNHTQASGKRYDEAKKGGGAGRRFRLRPELARSRALLQKYLDLTAGKTHTFAKDPRKVISMSLPNNASEFVYSLIRYANLAKLIIPEWTLRVYMSAQASIHERVMRKLHSLQIEVISIDSEEFTSSVPHELWKYLVLVDEAVDTFFIRRTEGSMFEFECAMMQSWIVEEADRSPVYCVPDFELGNDNNTLPMTACTWLGHLGVFRNDTILKHFSQKILNYANTFSHRHLDTIAGRAIEAFFSASTLGSIAEKYSESNSLVSFKNITEMLPYGILPSIDAKTLKRFM